MRSLIRTTAKHIVSKLVQEEKKRLGILSLPAKIADRRCYEDAVDHFKEHCFNFNQVCFLATLYSYLTPYLNHLDLYKISLYTKQASKQRTLWIRADVSMYWRQWICNKCIKFHLILNWKFNCCCEQIYQQISSKQIKFVIFIFQKGHLILFL